mmetsp:Transcript_11968/g.29279  ORF Transcript_11968/g.29279 Transcript_11968/m.29279 type:complete len:457 (+) Transcript_11968:105-1475(+)
MGAVQDNEAIQREDVQRRLKLASVLCGIFLVAELVGGIMSGSLAVLSDAAHLASDLMSFLFAVAAGHLAALPGSKTYTYGYRRWEVLAALFSMVSLAVCSVYLEGEGIRRLLPYITGIEVIEEVDGGVMSIIASIGVVVNIALAFVLGVENHVHMPGDDHGHDHDHGHASEDVIVEGQCTIVVTAADDGDGPSNDKKKKTALNFKFGDNSWHFGHGHDHSHSHGIAGCAPIASCAPIAENSKPPSLPSKENSEKAPSKPKENINLRAAYLHVLSDLAQSIAVLVAGVVIWYKPEWRIIDPILTLIFCPIIFYSTLGVIRSSMNILLEGAPPDVNVDELWTEIKSVGSVTSVSDLHVWSISHGAVAMTMNGTATDPQRALRIVHRLCTRSYGIGHCTIQLEQDGGADARGRKSGVVGSDNPGMSHCYNPNKKPVGGGDCELVGLLGKQHENEEGDFV